MPIHLKSKDVNPLNIHYIWVQLYLGRGRSRAAPSPVGSFASVYLHKVLLPLAKEETQAGHPSGRHMTGSFSDALHHNLHPARTHTHICNLCTIYLQMFPHHNLGKRKVFTEAFIWLDLILWAFCNRMLTGLHCTPWSKFTPYGFLQSV